MIVFLHIPKTAGSTFQFILENTFGVSACHTNHTKQHFFRQDDFEFARKFFPRMRRGVIQFWKRNYKTNVIPAPSTMQVMP